MVIRRSSCSFGRMEIRSSSDESQFMAFKARSRLPLKRRNELAAHPELPMTTKRPCEFCFPVLYVPAAPMVIGPFLFFGSLGSIRGESSLFVARLGSDDAHNFSTLVFSGFLTFDQR